MKNSNPSRPCALMSPKKLSLDPPNGKYAIGAGTPMFTPTIGATARWLNSLAALPLFGLESLNFTNSGRIVFASEKDGRNHLYSIGADGGPAQLLTKGDFDVEEVTLSGDRQSILYTSNQNDVDRRHIWRVSATGGDPQALTRGETIEWNPVETSDRKDVLCLGSTATSPAMPYRVTPKGRELIAKNAVPTEFPEPQLVAPKQVVFKSEDGLDIHGQLFVPKNQTARGPALIFMHGGPIRTMGVPPSSPPTSARVIPARRGTACRICT